MRTQIEKRILQGGEDMEIQLFDAQILLIATWLTVGKLISVPLIGYISAKRASPVFDVEVKPGQTRRELCALWLLVTDPIVLLICLGTGLLRLAEPTVLSTIMTFILMVVWGEWWMYWSHRWMHQYKLLWKWHRQHHLSRPTQALSSISFSVGEKLVFYTLGWLLFISVVSWVVPVSIWGIVGYYTIYFFASPIAHSNSTAFGVITKYGPAFIRNTIGTAESHGRHHMRFDCNYGFMTVFFDRLHSTYESEDQGKRVRRTYEEVTHG